MAGEARPFTLSEAEIALLERLLAGNRQLAGLLDDKEAGSAGAFKVRLRRAEAEELRAFLTVQLARVGFDRDYSLTDEGRKIEELIDRLYLP